jgi:NADH:ubiquinone oxidoreductase subunit 5 (subunit L)/multisubunit Na+/H+ antiporter MnhA subunit
VGSLFASLRSLFDNMTVIMLSMVTVVATCIFLFSQGYMHGDRDYPRFFAYLSYFCFAMLGLVVVDNLLVLFMFWELVGVGSYLLIGFFHDQPEPPRASLKAFMVNRVGDVLFLLGIIIAWQLFGTLNYPSSSSGWPGDFPPQPAPSRTSNTRCSRSQACSSSAAREEVGADPALRGCPTRWPARRRSRP